MTALSFSSVCAGTNFDGEDGRERERQQHRAADREGVRHRHRREDDAGDAGHREEREERDADDERARTSSAPRPRARPPGCARASCLCRAAPRCRKMFSIMMTVESTTMPKSTAPSEMRFARGAGRDHAAEGDEQRERDVDRRDERGARVCPRKRKSTTDDEQHPDEEVLEHGVRRQLHEVAAVVVGHDVHARRQDVVLADVVDALVDAGERRRRLAAVAHEDDALDDVGVVVVTDDAEARRRADLGRRRCPSRARDALLLGDDDVLDVVHVAQAGRCRAPRTPARP